ncbi:unnamed protein product [Protopolystoma xenopodis]|uniref:Uncharacterized protein n=1 Tax=Protopolystoma xenopodis TaxID=117903 RepID=A0A448XIQ6_9PLAT|nr:unnamed protein product [Protopolystoma xenopodis]
MSGTGGHVRQRPGDSVPLVSLLLRSCSLSSWPVSDLPAGGAASLAHFVLPGHRATEQAVRPTGLLAEALASYRRLSAERNPHKRTSISPLVSLSRGLSDAIDTPLPGPRDTLLDKEVYSRRDEKANVWLEGIRTGHQIRIALEWALFDPAKMSSAPRPLTPIQLH